MTAATTLMFEEASSSSLLVEGQRRDNSETLSSIRQMFGQRRPRALLTLARGSSDNAATFARYLIERRLGLVTASLAPSVSSVYQADIDFDGCLVLAISQSGRSPDIVGTTRRARASGANVIALVNDCTSPLALEADYLLQVGAGPESSVAATKSFTLSLTAILDLLSILSGDAVPPAMLDALPELLARAWQLDWSEAIEPLRKAESAFVVARGHAFGVAQELALKLKETCSIHAEAISSAEIRHGPMTLVGQGFPVFFLGQEDEALLDTTQLAREFVGRGAVVVHSGLELDAGIALPTIAADPILTPILQLQSFYRLCERLSRERGFDPDRPAHLNKVTRTL